MIKVILLKCNNIEKIKEIHKAYFNSNIIDKFKYIMQQKNIDTNTIGFIRKFFYNEDEIDSELIGQICCGNREALEKIILNYEKEIETYFYKRELEKCLLIIEKYDNYLKNDGYGKKLERFKLWERVIDNILNVIKNLEDKFFLARIKTRILTEKENISKYNIERDEDTSIYNFQFSVKKDIQKYIRDLKKIFEVDIDIKIKLQEIFDYEKFRDNKDEIYVKIDGEEIKYVWNRHKVITMMGVNVCPYCNRQFINSYIDEGTIKTTADLDHFYSQNKYPFLAISLYNFIPSCQICNSRFKIADNFYKSPHIYPYEEEFGQDAQFHTNFYTDKDVVRKEDKSIIEESNKYDISYLLGATNNFKIELMPNDKNSIKGTKIQNSIDTFHLEDLYNFHKDYVRELIKKAIVYNESRVDELFIQYPELFSSRDEVLQMLVSNYINNEELGKRPLAKLTKDICEELGLK